MDRREGDVSMTSIHKAYESSNKSKSKPNIQEDTQLFR